MHEAREQRPRPGRIAQRLGRCRRRAAQAWHRGLCYRVDQARGITRQQRMSEDAYLHFGDEFALQCVLERGSSSPAPESSDVAHAGEGKPVGFVVSRDTSLCCSFVAHTDQTLAAAASCTPRNAEDACFVIHTPNQYAAAKRLRKFQAQQDAAARNHTTSAQQGLNRLKAASLLQTLGGSGTKLTVEVPETATSHEPSASNPHEDSASTIDTLHRASKVEEDHNLSEMNLRKGQPVIFGKTIQLQSSSSGLFIQTEKMVAAEDDTAFRCSLSTLDQRSKLAYFRILPAYGTRHEGDRVRMSDTVVLQSVKDNMYLQCDSSDAMVGQQHEVKEATDSSPFLIVPIAKYHHITEAGNTFVRGGDFVQLYKRQSRTYLFRDVEGHPRILLPSENSESNYERHTSSDGESSRADVIWRLEKPGLSWGGKTLKNESGDRGNQYCLKDAMSGLFLATRGDLGLCFVLSSDTDAALWRLKPFDDDQVMYIYNRTPFCLENVATGGVLQHGKKVSSADSSEAGDSMTQSHPDQESAAYQSGETFELECVQTGEVSENDLFLFRSIPEETFSAFRAVQQRIEALHNYAIVALTLGNQGTAKALGNKTGTDSDVRDMAHSWRIKAEEHKTAKNKKGKRRHRHKKKNGREKNSADSDTQDRQRQQDAVAALKLHVRGQAETDEEGPVLSALNAFLMHLTVGFDSSSDPLLRQGLINEPLQKVLTEFRIVPLLLQLISATAQLILPKDIQSETYGPTFLLLVRLSFRMITVMVSKHHETRNSNFLFEKLQTLMRYLDFQLFGVADCITAVFNGNESMVASVQLSLMEDIWSRSIVDRQAKTLDFLCLLLDYEGSPIKHNQDRLINIIDSQYSAVSRNGKKIWRGVPTDLFDKSIWYKEMQDTNVHQMNFSTSFVKLAGLLCRGRHRRSIDFFLTAKQFGFEYSNVLQMMQRHTTNRRIQSAFAGLMLSLYVDMEPYQMRMPSQPLRIAPTIPVESLNFAPLVAEDPYKSLPTDFERPPSDFADLRAAIIAILKDAKPNITRDKAELLIVTVALARFLLLCGFYDNAVTYGSRTQANAVLQLGSEGRELATVLVSILDGRAEKTDGAHSRYALTLSNKVLMELKQESLRLLLILFRVRDSTRIENLIQMVYQDARDGQPLPAAQLLNVLTGVEIKQDKAVDFKESWIPDETENNETVGEADDFENPLAGIGGVSNCADSESLAMAMPVFDVETRAISQDKKVRRRKRDLSEPVETTQERLSSFLSEEIMKVRVFEQDTAEGSAVVEVLLDCLRYQSVDLGFIGFDALIFYISQSCAFSQTLREVVVIDTMSDATAFLELQQLVFKCRQKLPWLHQADACLECETHVKTLAAKCEGPSQDLLRNLDIVDVVIQLMKTIEQSDEFVSLLNTTLALVGHFCNRNLDNQNAMASHIDVIFQLLQKEVHIDSAAKCLCNIFAEHDDLCTNLSQRVVYLVGHVTTEYGRRATLLLLLQRMLVGEYKPNVKAQQMICKGAMQSSYLIDIACELEKDEWGAGPPVSRIDAIRNVLNDDKDNDLKSRCQLQTDYYCESLVMLACCAYGENAATELLCASLMPFHEVMLRLWEILEHPDLEYTDPSKGGSIKYATLTFFRNIFVDTASVHVLRAMRRPKNGMWSLGSEVDTVYFVSTPIGTLICDDIALLVPSEEERVDTAVELPIMTKDKHGFREYIFEGIQLFIQFTYHGQPLDHMVHEDKSTARRVYRQCLQIATAALENGGPWSPASSAWHQGALGWDASEKVLLLNLKEISSAYLAGQPLSKAALEMSTQASVNDDVTGLSNTWAYAVQGIQNNLPVGAIAGSGHIVGIGIMAVAKRLWSRVEPEEGQDRYEVDVDRRFCGELVTPLLDKLETLRYSPSKELLPLLMTMMEAVRAIPYGASAHGPLEGVAMKSAFQRFLNADPLNARIDPELARTQLAMVEQGWSLLCFRVLGMPELPSMHLPAIRLLLAMTGGTSTETRDLMLSQLADRSQCPREICCIVFRHLLRLSVDDLKIWRHASSNAATGSAVVDITERGHATEVLDLMFNMCQSDHGSPHGAMQLYLEKQPSHLQEINIITEIVAYCGHIESAVATAMRRPDGASDATKHIDSKMILRIRAAFKVLIVMTSGPQPENQRALGCTPIAAVINRIFRNSHYTFDDVSGRNAAQRPRRLMVGICTRLILTMLEGAPSSDVILSLITSIDWKLQRNLFRNYKMIITEGQVIAESSYAVGKDASVSTPTPTSPRAVTEPEIEAGPRLTHKERRARWLSREAYKMVTYVQKLVIAAEKLSSDVEQILLPMQSLLDDECIEFFTKRIAYVEVVRNDKLERLFFVLPDSYHNAHDRKQVEATLHTKMNHIRRDNAELMQKEFIRICQETMRMKQLTQNLSTSNILRLRQFTKVIIPGNDDVLAVSFAIMIVLLVSFDDSCPGIDIGHDNISVAGSRIQEDTSCSHRSHSLSTYARAPNPHIAYLLFLYFGLLHVFVCVAAFFEFVKVRVKVLIEHKALNARINFPNIPEHRRMFQRHEFLQRTVHLFGFSAEFASSEFISSLMSRYGAVSSLEVVEQKSMSWAVVEFSSLQAVRKLMMGLQDVEGADTPGLEITGRSNGINHMLVAQCDDEYVASIMQLQSFVEAKLRQQGDTSKQDPVYKVVAKAQQMLNTMLPRVGPHIPIETVYDLRWNIEFWEAVADIVFSVAGFFWSPLLLSYHLFKMTKQEGASIVIKSISTNWRRLFTTFCLALLWIYLFSVVGLLYFKDDHTGLKAENENGPCASLLTCFVSYCLSGFTQQGLSLWLEYPFLPEFGEDIFTMHFARLSWEISFMFVTSCIVIAIITGVICDTFGELRMAVDDAVEYRSTTCFVTGIPFSVLPYETGTDFLTYAYLVLYLNEMTEIDSSGQNLSPLEQDVLSQIRMGDVSWLPKGRCFSMQHHKQKEALMESELQEIKAMMSQLLSQHSESSSSEVRDLRARFDKMEAQNR